MDARPYSGPCSVTKSGGCSVISASRASGPVDLWEFSRPNLGTASTVENPYEVHRVGQWRCDDVDVVEVEGFRADVEDMMEEYRQVRQADGAIELAIGQ